VPSDTSVIAPRDPVWGSPAPELLVVREGGMELGVRLCEGLAPGLYLDQRRNRARVRASSAGKRVLNLFAYTCAFSVAAMMGGARETISVDSSMKALERGRENLVRAGADLSKHVLVMDDAAGYLARARRKGERFDLVILDPPSFGRAGSRRFSADESFEALATAAIAVLGKDGVLLACTNHRKTTQKTLRRLLHDAARAARRATLQMKDLAVDVDFPARGGMEPTMKSVWLRLDG